MKNVLGLFSMIFIFGISKVKSQTSLNEISVNIRKENSYKFNFFDSISFTPPSKIAQPTQNTFIKIKHPALHVVCSGSFASNIIEKLNLTCLKYAMLMGVNVESLTNPALYDFIKEWFGTRYRFGGKTKKGIDCSAFTGTLLSAVYSLVVPRTARLQYKACERINKDNLLEGDLVFFNTRGGVSHVGLYLSNGYFVHSASSKGVMISSLDDHYFSKRFISGGRIN